MGAKWHDARAASRRAGWMTLGGVAELRSFNYLWEEGPVGGGRDVAQSLRLRITAAQDYCGSGLSKLRSHSGATHSASIQWGTDSFVASIEVGRRERSNRPGAVRKRSEAN